MFSLREFLMKGFKDAIGSMADYQIILNATGYYEKNVLTEDDLAELQSLIDEKNTSVEVSEPPAEITETDGLPIFPTEADAVTDEAVSEPQTEG